MRAFEIPPLRIDSSLECRSAIPCRRKELNKLNAPLLAFVALVVSGGLVSADAYAASTQQILNARPLAPTDISLFSPVAYPDAPPLVPAQGPERDVNEAYIAITDYFKRQSGLRQRALEIFYDETAIQKIPNPTLRAGLTGLLGTAGEPAINFILKAKTPAGLPKVFAVAFSADPFDPSETATAFALVEPSSQQVSYVFNPKYTSEDPFLFSNIIAHEALHSDIPVTTTEEVINLALQSSIYLEQLVKHTDLVRQGTELARRNNTNALARLNSGVGAELGLFASNGDQQILPGSVVPATSWFGQFENAPGFADTPGSPLLRQILAKLRESGNRLSSKPNFDMNTLNFIDQNSRNLSAAELVRAARALRLQLP